MACETARGRRGRRRRDYRGVGRRARPTARRRGGARRPVDPGSGASSVAGGMLAPVTEAWPGERELLELGAASLAALAGVRRRPSRRRPGRRVGLRTDGTLAVVVDSADREDLDRIVAHLRDWGRDAERLTGREARRREPALGPAVRGRAGRARRPRRRQPAAARRAARGGRRAGRGGGAAPRRRSGSHDAGGAVTGVELDDGRCWRRSGSWWRRARGRRRCTPPSTASSARSRARSCASVPAGARCRRPRARCGPRSSGRAVYAVPARRRAARARRDAVRGRVRRRRHRRRRPRPPRSTPSGCCPGSPTTRSRSARRRSGPAAPTTCRCSAPLGAPDGLVAATGHGRNGILLTALTADVLADALAGRPCPPAATCAAASRAHPSGGRLVKVWLNGEAQDVADAASVADVLGAHGVPSRGVAVAVDGEVVPRAAWATSSLVEGARARGPHRRAGRLTMGDPLVIAGREIGSRLIMGTGGRVEPVGARARARGVGDRADDGRDAPPRRRRRPRGAGAAVPAGDRPRCRTPRAAAPPPRRCSPRGWPARRWRPTGSSSRSSPTTAHLLARLRRAPRRRRAARRRRLHRPALHQRRPRGGDRSSPTPGAPR